VNTYTIAPQAFPVNTSCWQRGQSISKATDEPREPQDMPNDLAVRVRPPPLRQDRRISDQDTVSPPERRSVALTAARKRTAWPRLEVSMTLRSSQARRQSLTVSG